MKITREKYSILLLILLLAALSCAKDDLRGITNNLNSIKWTGIEVKNMDNSGEHPSIISTSEPIPVLAYAIALDLHDSSKHFQSGGSLEGGYNKVIETPIKSISITSLQRFNEAHPIGASLNEYFKIRPGIREGHMKQLSNAKPLDIYYLSFTNDLLLFQFPDKEAQYQFAVKIELANNIVFTDTTAPVYLTK